MDGFLRRENRLVKCLRRVGRFLRRVDKLVGCLRWVDRFLRRADSFLRRVDKVETICRPVVKVDNKQSVLTKQFGPLIRA